MVRHRGQRQGPGRRTLSEGVAVIASKLAAETYGLEIVQEGIEDLRHNYTRFFVVGKGEAKKVPGCKTSLVFAVPNTPGSLYRSLGEFAERGVNLTKLESRPRRNRPWQYVFYVDFEGHWQEEAPAQALLSLLSHAAFRQAAGQLPRGIHVR